MSPRRTDTSSRDIAASPEAILAAFQRDELMKWLPPGNMEGRVHEYDLRTGGRYRWELTHRDDGHGKSSRHGDVTKGRFVAVEASRIVQTVEFESEDEAFAGEMTMTWSLQPSPMGTRVTITAENVPPGVSEEDHAVGLRSTLENLARHVE